MYRQTVIIGIVLAVFSLSGCNLLDAGEGDGLAFTTEAESYEPGDRVTLNLENDSGQRVGYNLCLSSLQRRTANAWTRPEAADGDINNDGTREACTMQMNTMDSGEEVSYDKGLPIDLAEGAYRFQNSVTLLEEEPERDVTITTNVFVVQ